MAEESEEERAMGCGAAGGRSELEGGRLTLIPFEPVAPAALSSECVCGTAVTRRAPFVARTERTCAGADKGWWRTEGGDAELRQSRAQHSDGDGDGRGWPIVRCI